MKVLAALPCVLAVDDSSTLLSLKVQTTLETGVDHLLDAVGSRNVTQMASLLQNLVEDTIGEGPYELDGDVSAALDVIKRELIGDIRGALNEAHCYAQSDLHIQMLCFKRCEDKRGVGTDWCNRKPDGGRCDGMAHKDCRLDLLELYKVHITECRALDAFVPVMPCPKAPKACCLLPHTTWNCEGLCAGTISKLHVDDEFGNWLMGMIATYEGHYVTWTDLHKKCKASYKAYVEKDATCDCEQARCETTNCKWDSCMFSTCEDEYQRCWAGCEAEVEISIPPTECQEKDRKIDWSATEKIECYVNVLLEKPTPKELLDTCGSETCYNQYREEMYKKCNEICVEVDFTNEKAEVTAHTRRLHADAAYSGEKTDVKDQSTGNVVDQDVTKEGAKSVRTMHRSDDGNENGRCTSHLDIDYLENPPCTACIERPSRPCEESGGAYAAGDNTYMWLHYDQYDFRSTDDIKGFNEVTCRKNVGEHTWAYAYNLCPCLDCEKNPDPPKQVCTTGKGGYDYSVHDIQVDCGAISKSNPTYGGSDEPIVGR